MSLSASGVTVWYHSCFLFLWALSEVMEFEQPYIYVLCRFKDVRIGKPAVSMGDGVVDNLTPQKCRLTDMTYVLIPASILWYFVNFWLWFLPLLNKVSWKLETHGLCVPQSSLGRWGICFSRWKTGFYKIFFKDEKLDWSLFFKMKKLVEPKFNSKCPHGGFPARFSVLHILFSS